MEHGLIVMEDLGTVLVRPPAARSGVEQGGERIRRELAKGIGETADNNFFTRRMLGACDGHGGPLTRVAGERQQLGAGHCAPESSFSLELLVRMLDEAMLFPAVAETTLRTLEVVSRKWKHVKAMPLYPTFRR